MTCKYRRPRQTQTHRRRRKKNIVHRRAIRRVNKSLMYSRACEQVDATRTPFFLSTEEIASKINDFFFRYCGFDRCVSAGWVGIFFFASDGFKRSVDVFGFRFDIDGWCICRLGAFFLRNQVQRHFCCNADFGTIDSVMKNLWRSDIFK